ncbi:MAG: protein-glutamate O-methyltransferase CheR [Pseudomonadota bacterium]
MPQGVSHAPRLTPRDFKQLAALIEERTGVRMPPNKQTMVEGRLHRRLRERGLSSFADYCHFLFEEGGLEVEIADLIDLVTTHKTEFFREPQHFEILTEQVVPALLHRDIGIHRPLKVWSAACSIGAEPYTLAMVLNDYRVSQPALHFRIMGTDISTQVLKTATQAIYPEEMAEPIPLPLRQRYLLRSRDPTAQQIRMAPEMRGLVEFRAINFMDDHYDLPSLQDIVFCRNVIIYFDMPVRTLVLQRICQQITVGGYLFMGHSETLSGMPLPLRQVFPTVYQRTPYVT